MALPAGGIADKLGARTVLAVAVGTSFAALAGIAILPAEYAVIVVLLALAGIANGLAQPAGNVAVRDGVPARLQGFGFGLKQAAVPLANLAVGLLVALVAGLNWRAAFAVAAGSAVAAGVLVNLLPRGRRHGPLGAQEHRPVTNPPRSLRRRWLVLLALGGWCGAASNTMLASFLVISLVRHDVTPAAAGAVYAVGAGLCFAVRASAGWLLTRDVLRVVAGMLVIAMLCMLALGTDAPQPFLLSAAVMAMGVGWGWQGLFAHAVAELGPDRPGAATGLTHAGIFAGGACGPPAFGIIAQSSFSIAWFTAATVALIAAVTVLAGRRAGRHARPNTHSSDIARQ